mgnify:CR=1 FL=1
MEQFVWETAEELDQKLAQRVRNIRKTTLYFSGKNYLP